MALSAVGKKKVALHGGLVVVTIIVLALAARVNQFQEFFFAADLFPLALSIVSLVLLAIMLAMDFALSRSYSKFEIGMLAIMTLLWLIFNAFSTSRWTGVSSCGSIPDGFDDVRTWCRDLQALKGFVWVEWLFFLFSTVFTIRVAKTQKTRDSTFIFHVPKDPYA